MGTRSADFPRRSLDQQVVATEAWRGEAQASGPVGATPKRNRTAERSASIPGRSAGRRSVVLLSFVLVGGLAGRAAAAVATAGVAALAAWGVLLIWAAGSQDLWMLVFGLATMLAFVRSRRGWAVVFQGLALISKETSAVLP